MTTEGRGELRKAVAKIPCSLAVSTDDGEGAAWLMCCECPRCLLLQALIHEDPTEFIQEYILPLPDDGGHKLRKDLGHTRDKK